MRWWIRSVARYLAGRRLRGQFERDLAEELRFHVDQQTAKNQRAGMPADEARRQALLMFGGMEASKERVRDEVRPAWLEDFVADLRYGLRTLRRSPGFASTAFVVIALGIGATTAAFSLLDAVLLRPLPFPHSDRLVRLYETELTRDIPRIETSPPNFVDWRTTNTSFSSTGAYLGTFPVTLSGFGEPAPLQMSYFDAGVLTTLGVRPAAGRSLTPEDDRDGAPDVVLMSANLAVTLFGNARAAVGHTLILDDRPRTVIGVMPPGFSYPTADVSLWAPLSFSLVGLARTNHVLQVVARLRPDVSLKQARTDMAVIARRLEAAYPKDDSGVGAAVLSMREVISPQATMLVMAIFGAALCLLVIACTNLANLLLARALARRHEFAVRIAMGAGRGRLVRQVLTESSILGGTGGVAGAILAVIVAPWLARFVPNQLPFGNEPLVDMRVFTFAIVLTLVTVLAFGLAPALRSWQHADPKSLRSRAGGDPAQGLRTGLVLAEIAATVILLVVAGLLVKALWRVQTVDPGFRTDGVLTVETSLPLPRYRAATTRQRFYERVLAETGRLPGVESVAYTTGLPLVFGAGIFPVTTAGLVKDPMTAPRASIRFVTPGFFTTLRIPLRKGRYLTAGDDAEAPFVAIVSESLAQRLWPGQDPIGRQLRVWLSQTSSERTVVGVVGDIAVRGLEQRSEPQVYATAEQLAPFSTFYAPRDLVVRAAGDPVALAPAIRRIVHEVDPSEPVTKVRPLEQIVARETAPRRNQLAIVWSFAVIALLLAAVGIHGLLSFIVSTRTRDIGVRIALGASRTSVLRLFLRRGLMLGTLGIVVGVPGAYVAARAMTTLLFDVKPSDPTIYSVAALLGVTMAIAGALAPAIRASAIDPAITMRTD